MFAWDACDALGIDPAFICHHLNVNPSITPKKQPPQCPSREHVDAIRGEVMKLKHAETIKEVFYPEWLANTIVVKKKKWKVASLCRLHGPKQSMPKGPVPHASDRPAGGHKSGPSSDEFPGRLLGLSSNTAGPGGSGEDSLCDAYYELSLQSNVVWPEEYRFHLSKDDDENVRATIRQEHRNLC